MLYTDSYAYTCSSIGVPREGDSDVGLSRFLDQASVAYLLALLLLVVVVVAVVVLVVVVVVVWLLLCY